MRLGVLFGVCARMMSSMDGALDDVTEGVTDGVIDGAPDFLWFNVRVSFPREVRSSVVRWEVEPLDANDCEVFLDGLSRDRDEPGVRFSSSSVDEAALLLDLRDLPPPSTIPGGGFGSGG